MPQLFVLQGPQSGQIYPFTRRITIGYRPGCDIVLTGGTDTNHTLLLEIVRQAESYYLRKKAAIAVTINGRQVEDGPLQHGNVIALENMVLLFNAAPQEGILQANAATPPRGMPATIVAGNEKQRLLSLYQAANLIYLSSDLKELVEELAKFFLHTFNAGSCIILLKESYSEDLRVVMYKKNDRYASELEDLQLQLTRKKLNLVYKRQKALLWRDWRYNRGFYFMTAPLSHYHKTLGLVLLESKAIKKIAGQQQQAFTEQDLYILGEINLIVANGIANILNYLEKREHTRRLENLNKVTVKLSSLLSRKAIYREAARDVCSILKCTKSSVMYVDDKRIIRMGYAVGIHKQYYRKIATVYGKGLVGWVIKHGKSLLSSNLPVALKPKYRQKYRTDSFLIVPIFKSSGKKTETIGVICATDRLDKIPFSRNDKELLTLIARQVGIALTNASLYEQATVDFLTRIYMRGHFFEKMAEILQNVRHNSENISLLMLDLDFFKSVNDNYGHQVGDFILQELGSIINNSVREGDLAGRYGGEEFIILLANTTYAVACKIAERIRATVEKHTFQVDKLSLRLTISIGVAEYIGGESSEDLILRADRALYQAKKSGRNQVR